MLRRVERPVHCLLQLLFFDLRVRVGPARLLVSGVPPMEMFPALPAPLRQFLGLRAARVGARDPAAGEGDQGELATLRWTRGGSSDGSNAR